jgi:hypothetical protein
MNNLHDLFQRQRHASRENVLDYAQRMAALGGLLNAILANERALSTRCTRTSAVAQRRKPVFWKSCRSSTKFAISAAISTSG